MKNILLHLRIPFSFFLMPVYLFALSQAPSIDTVKAWWIFVILHLLVFPASNAYNSYYDKDEGSIGLLEAPPPVTKTLWRTAWMMDILALVLSSWFVDNAFTVFLLLYGFTSKAYSHPYTRLKKYPIASWLVVAIFQGAATYLAVFYSVSATFQEDTPLLQTSPTLIAAAICTCNLLAIYPITQVYQHEEDAKRGDLTMSRLLGIRGTFLNALFWLGLSGIGFVVYFQDWQKLLLLFVLLGPLVGFLLVWMWRVWQDERQANFKNTMLLNLLAGILLNLFFGVLYFWR
ncbi:MAG: UbiA family prenyltransferase [Spirosomaceae bacterium]|jgi:1,4-dihydroxy-2-naphthoate octaprenyltransferase|nr:UbiA family prenyltransferase [Spirosomataceae bacterium]